MLINLSIFTNFLSKHGQFRSDFRGLVPSLPCKSSDVNWYSNVNHKLIAVFSEFLFKSVLNIIFDQNSSSIKQVYKITLHVQFGQPCFINNQVGSTSSDASLLSLGRNQSTWLRISRYKNHMRFLCLKKVTEKSELFLMINKFTKIQNVTYGQFPYQ